MTRSQQNFQTSGCAIDGGIEWVNPAFEKITGWRLDEIEGRRPGRFLQCAETDPEAVAKIRRALQRVEPVEAEILNRSRTGQEYWLKIEILPRIDAQGVHTGFLAVETDITDLVAAREAARRAEAEAARTRQQLVDAVEALDDGFFLFDADDRLVLANARARDLFPNTAAAMRPGATAEQIVRRAVASGDVADSQLENDPET